MLTCVNKGSPSANVNMTQLKAQETVANFALFYHIYIYIIYADHTISVTSSFIVVSVACETVFYKVNHISRTDISHIKEVLSSTILISDIKPSNIYEWIMETAHVVNYYVPKLAQ